MKWMRNISVLVLVALVTACSTMECPLNNMVRAKFGVYNALGKRDTLIDTTTIYTHRVSGTDSILKNRLYGDTIFSLPLSYSHERDTFFFDFTDHNNVVRKDTVVISKTDRMHFESVECAASYFHTLEGVSTTKHAIDSVVLHHKEVNYDSSKEHFRIYFHPRN